MAVVILNKTNFEAEVMGSDRPVLIDFYADWCGPCRMVGPIVEEIAEEHPEYKVCKVNVDDDSAIAMQYNVMSIPNFIFFKNGENVKNIVGGMSPKDFEQNIAAFLG